MISNRFFVELFPTVKIPSRDLFPRPPAFSFLECCQKPKSFFYPLLMCDQALEGLEPNLARNSAF